MILTLDHCDIHSRVVVSRDGCVVESDFGVHKYPAVVQILQDILNYLHNHEPTSQGRGAKSTASRVRGSKGCVMNTFDSRVVKVGDDLLFKGATWILHLKFIEDRTHPRGDP